MDKKPDLSKRVSRPTSLGGAFGNLLRAFGRSASDADLSARWDEIVGADIASQAILVGISKPASRLAPRASRTLTIKSLNPAGALALSYRKDEIIRLVNKYFGYDAVAKITIKK
ncbi:MAG: DUF721 domain-containing protein [Alphaproteobacteria bacterium]|nr:DUF721 domain-containing protein [Alphaproteobacteria bacterium]MCL2757764.1 DUF721 domain-containing protein [Alphaproteobacteria bacterium]